jgi:protein tyrosine phosphatase (PTP) superfamily phosphohydrolase (DUF442 family)
MPSPIDALQGVVNANQALPNVVTAGQPGPEHFRALKAAGVEVVLEELGLEYIVVPITDQTLTDETLDRITETMRANARRQILVHCASGNRIGGALVPYLMLDQGFTEDDASMAALRIGLRGAHLLQWGIDYVRAREETP